MSETQGIDVKELTPGRHWKEAWPLGHTDDGTNDDKILNNEDAAAEKEAPKPIVYHQAPLAVEGQWPYGCSYTENHEVASCWGHLDDGTDDDTVINAQLKSQMLA